MNIFIYGNASFKSDIHKIFERSNIKFRLTENDSIKEINTLIELRTSIENYPKDIFLIDDSKIFRKNALNEKIKFLKPKGSIDEEFIKSHGIGDISIDSLEDLPKYIIKKIEETNPTSQDDDYHNSRDNSDIQESIIGIVDDAYNNDFDDENLINNEIIGDIEEENDKIQLDDELSSLLSYEDDIPDEDEFSISDDTFEDDIEEFKDLNEEEIIDEEGNNMSDEFSELDDLRESDILAALDGLEDIDVNSIMPAQTQAVAQNSSQTSQSNTGVEVNGSNVNDIASLISELLNNKTLEITIKVKA